MAQNLRGQYLIAAKQLRDSNFFKTVVLIIEHGSEGAMGLVVNRPSSVTVANALSGHFEIPETDDLVYVGGPVEPSALFILHNSAELNGGETPVVQGLYVGSNAEIFESVVRSSVQGDPDTKFRIFSGCAGWAPEQLEGEIGRGDWYVQPTSDTMLFYEDPYQVWEHLFRKVQDAVAILPPCPGNPEMN